MNFVKYFAQILLNKNRLFCNTFFQFGKKLQKRVFNLTIKVYNNYIKQYEEK